MALCVKCFVHDLTVKHILSLTLLVANLAITKWCKKLKYDWNPGTWVLIWECSVKAIQWIPTWQGLDGFQKSLHPLHWKGYDLYCTITTSLLSHPSGMSCLRLLLTAATCCHVTSELSDRQWPVSWWSNCAVTRENCPKLSSAWEPGYIGRRG